MTEPITMTVRIGSGGLDIAEAEYAGQRFTVSSRNGVSMKLARALVEAGAPDEPVAVYGTDNCLRYTSPSLHLLARWTIEESDRGIRQRRWKPPPMGGEAGHDGVDSDARPETPAFRENALAGRFLSVRASCAFLGAEGIEGLIYASNDALAALACTPRRGDRVRFRIAKTRDGRREAVDLVLMEQPV